MSDAPGLWPVPMPDGTFLWCVVGGFAIGGWVVPDGFLTDLASIPRWLRWVPGLNPYAPDTAAAAGGHDYLLSIGVDQRVAAAWFYVLMRDWGVARAKRVIFYAGVVLAIDDW